MPTSAFLGCAEPSWAGSVSERQLIGLLNLSALFTSNVYLSDVHLGDNRNFLSSYRLGSSRGLYLHLRGLTEAGITRLLLRKYSYRPRAEPDRFPCSSFFDVYRSWLAQDDNAAWIVHPDTEGRDGFFEDLDRWATSQAIVRYDYERVKRTFMREVRDSATHADTPLRNSLENLPLTVRNEYDQIIQRDWFSLSDIYSHFQRHGVGPSNPVMLSHGMANELAYNDMLDSSMVGVDVFDAPLEAWLWPDIAQSQKDGPVALTKPLSYFLERAYEVLDAPDLSLLGVLTPQQIVALRDEAGTGYFDLLTLSGDWEYLSNHDDFGRRLASAAVDYWREICEHLWSHHTAAAARPRKIAVMLGELPGPLGRGADRMVSFAINVGVPKTSTDAIAAAGAPAMAGSISQHLKLALDSCLRFMFLAKSEELIHLRSVVPDRTWLTRPQA
jgi:hypothetical protein